MLKRIFIVSEIALLIVFMQVVNIFGVVDDFYKDNFYIEGVEITQKMIRVPDEYTIAEGNGVFDDVTGYIYRHYQSKAQSYTTDYSGEVYGYWFISTTENIKKMDLSDNNYEWGKHPECYSTLFPKGVFKDKPNMKYLYGAHNYNCIDGRAFENCAVRSVRIPQKKYYSQSVYWNNPYQGWKVSDKKIRPLNYSLIDSEAFVNCPNLTSVIIDGMETVIEDNAFVNCGDITIYCPRGSKAEEFAKRNGYKYQNITTESFYGEYRDVYPYRYHEARTVILNEMTELEKKIFDEELYLLYNPELVDSPFDSEELLYAHWLANGLQSGGSHVFDAEYYLNANPDLKKAFGDDKEAAYRHFLLNGYKELRDSSPEYCGKAYKNRYKDLADMTSEQLITHYLSYGINEGRNAAAERAFIYGDVNCDGALTSADSTYIMQKVLNADFKMPIELYTNEYKKYADVDGDNMLTANDALCVMQKVLNKSYKMPIK